MRALFLFALLILTAPSAPAQNAPRIVDVQLTSFDFTPSEIRLRTGVPVELRLTNAGRGDHNFSAPQFFRAASIPPGQTGIIQSGAIEVPSRRTMTVRLTPARGTYRLRCTHTLHTAFGMRGRIIVE